MTKGKDWYIVITFCQKHILNYKKCDLNISAYGISCFQQYAVYFSVVMLDVNKIGVSCRPGMACLQVADEKAGFCM